MNGESRSRSEFEQGALEDLLLALGERGHDAQDLCAPDLDDSDELNVDARFTIDGTEWAVEHIRVVYEENLIPADKFARSELEVGLRPLADEHDVIIHVSLYPPRWEKGGKRPQDFYAEVIERGRRAVVAMKDDVQRDAQIYVRKGEPEVVVYGWTTDDASLHNQLVKGLKDPLYKKKAKQFLPAKRLGLPVLLLLDQVTNPSSEAIPQMNYSNETLLGAVGEILRPEDDVVDELWLRRPDRKCSRLWPTEPEQFSDGLSDLWK